MYNNIFHLSISIEIGHKKKKMSRAKIFVISINNRLQYVLTSKEMSSTEKSMLHIPGRYVVIYYSLFEKEKYIYYQRRRIREHASLFFWHLFWEFPSLTFSLIQKYNCVLLILLTAMIPLFIHKNRINVIGNSKE